MPRGFNSILLQIDTTRPGGLQTQIREFFVSAILSGSLIPGEALPSTRNLARQLAVSRNTVILAYQALMDSGYIESRDRSGFVVSRDAPVSTTAPHGSDALSKARGPISTAGEQIDWQQKFITRQTPPQVLEKPLDWRDYAYPFIYGQADSQLFSHSEWRDCARQALGIRDFATIAGDFGFNDDPMLVDYICSHSLPRRGIRVRPEQILVTVGAQNALFLLAQLLVDNDRRVVIEDPFYPDLRDLLRRRTSQIITLEVDSQGLVMDEERLAMADLVIITPSHQCPTTATMALERRKQLLMLAEKHDFLIIEDDYEFEMNFLAPPAPALKSMDEHGRVLYVGSFSKSLFPGLRLGYLAGSAPLIEAARSLRHLMLRHPPGLTQRTAAYFMALGHYDAQIRRLRRHLEERRRALQTALDASPLLIETAARFGGTSFWVHGPDWLDARELAREAASDGVLIEPGDIFFASSSPPKQYFRLAYSSIAASRIGAGMERLNAAMERLRPG